MKSFYSPCKRKLPNIRQLRHPGGLNQKRKVNNFTQTKGGLKRIDLYYTIYKSAKCEIVTTFCIKICMIRFLKDRKSSISSDSKEILKPNKSHTKSIIQIVPCKTALISTYQMQGSQERTHHFRRSYVPLSLKSFRI